MFQLNRMSIKMWREKKCGGKCNQWIVRKTLEISFDPINKCFYPWGFDRKCPPATSVLTRLVGRSTMYRGGDTEWQVIMRTQTSSVDWSLVSYSEEVVGWSKSPKYCPSMLLPFSLLPEGQDEASFSSSCPWTPCAASPHLTWKIWHQEPKQACHPLCCFSCVFYHSRRANAISFQRIHFVTLAHLLSH